MKHPKLSGGCLPKEKLLHVGRKDGQFTGLNSNQEITKRLYKQKEGLLENKSETLQSKKNQSGSWLDIAGRHLAVYQPLPTQDRRAMGWHKQLHSDGTEGCNIQGDRAGTTPCCPSMNPWDAFSAVCASARCWECQR